MTMLRRNGAPWRHLVTSLFAVLLAPWLLRAQVPAPPVAPAAPAAPATAVERPFLWRLEGPTPNYLFGTIHLPDERVTTLGPSVQAALDEATALYTEIPMELGELMQAQSRTMLPKGTTLRDRIGDELYDRLATYVEGKGHKMAMLDRVQPWAAATQLMLLDQMKEMALRQPLDMQLYSGAKKQKKQVGGLETLDEQLAVFGGLTDGEQTSLLRAMLDQAIDYEAKGIRPVEQLLQLYLRGDEAAIDQLMNEYPMGDEKLRAKLMQRLLADRNWRMADRIVRLMQEHPDRVHFFAVGAAHYSGEDGLLRMLAARGYQLTRLGDDPAVVRQREQQALDAEIARLRAALAALEARRSRLQPAGGVR